MTGPLLSVRNLTVRFSARGARPATVAVDALSLEIARGETVALVGGSGSGKTTAALAILRLCDARAGQVTFDGTELLTLGAAPLRALRHRLQIVFQDPSRALTPWMTVHELVAEPLLHAARATAATLDDVVRARLAEVGLANDLAARVPAELSGGQRQRVALARALGTDPDFLVLDEAVSALDVAVQEQILALLSRLKSERGLTCLFITHNLGVVRRIADRVAVMQNGRLVETGSVPDFFSGPTHPYSRALMAAVPSLDPPAAPAGSR
jgi:peptide/nickel transport system ATP-binding protein